MPRFRFHAALLFVLLPALARPSVAERARKPKPPLPAQQYAMHDTHPREHVTIAAEPGDTKETRPNTRLDYYSHEMMPIRVIVTNDSDFALTLDDARIDLITGGDSAVPAATDEDLERRMFTFKSALGRKIPLPMPLPPITVHSGSVDKKVVEDDRDFGFQTTTVPPHSTVAGYLFYDMQGVDPPFLSHATLELRKVRFAATGQALDSFEIPLHPTAKDAAAARAGDAQP